MRDARAADSLSRRPVAGLRVRCGRPHGSYCRWARTGAAHRGGTRPRRLKRIAEETKGQEHWNSEPTKHVLTPQVRAVSGTGGEVRRVACPLSAEGSMADVSYPRAGIVKNTYNFQTIRTRVIRVDIGSKCLV
jgi:hypothetical protein